ncbi:MAG TPA: hypothetical protein VFC21_10645 [Bryobacteraceae bacterium]|nr:hypothetical protein [Bryobacteraceae bacterium]
MNRLIITFAIGAFATGVFAVAAHRDYKLEEREPFHHTFSNDTTLDVDTVSGSINVTGDGGNTIRVDGEKVIRAADREEVQRAKREVVLDVNEKNGTAQLYVNGPFRDNDHTSESHGFHDRRDREYEVAYNFTIHVPSALALTLHTINGDIATQGTAGKFNIKGLNGKITMTDIAGSGTADTLNGSTVITFRENPKADSYFKSFNGKVDVGFQPGLSANLSLKTFNGSAWTDFEATALASMAEPGQRQNGKYVYKSNKFNNLRVGSGGPELKFETFNGNIQIRKLPR